MAAEHAFIAMALRFKWNVAQPIVPGPIDLLIKRGDAWESVQVKLASKELRTKEHGMRIVASTIRRGVGRKKKYVQGDFDLLAVMYESCCWLVPFIELSGSHLRFYVDGTRGKYEKWRIA